MNNGNDNGLAVKGCDGGTQRITVTCSPGTQALGLDVDCLNLDVALSLLQRATRELESRYRFARAQELAREAIQNQQSAEIAARVMHAKSQRA